MSRAGRLLEAVGDDVQDVPATSSFEMALLEISGEWDAREVQSALFQVIGSDRTIRVLYEIGFKRNTRTIAYQDNKQLIDYCNRVLQDIADKYGTGATSKVNPLTLEYAAQLDKDAEAAGQDAYSEFEQTFGGSMSLSFT